MPFTKKNNKNVAFITDPVILNESTGIRSLILSYAYHLNKSGRYTNLLIDSGPSNSIYSLSDNQYLLDRGFVGNVCMGKSKKEIINNIANLKILSDYKKKTYRPPVITNKKNFDAVFLSDPWVAARTNLSNFKCKIYCISHDNIEALDYFQHPSWDALIFAEERNLGLKFSSNKNGIICTTKEAQKHLEILGFGKNRVLKTMPIVTPPGYENINLTGGDRKACILAVPFSVRKGRTIIPELLNNSSFEQVIVFGYPSLSDIIDVSHFFNKINIDNIEWWTNATYEKQIELYLRSKTLLFPSQIEGLGIPVLEAMACGCSALTFDIPPINEIVHPEDILPDNLEGACLKVAEHSKRSIDHDKYQQKLYDFLHKQDNFETEFSKLLN